MSTWRAKAAATVLLFFLGLSAGQFGRLLETVRGNVARGAATTEQIRSTVSTLRQIDTAALEAQIAALQLKLTAGAATPAQVEELRQLVAKLRAVQGPAGAPGPSGPTGAVGPPGPAGAAATTTTTSPAPGGTTTSTRAPTTTTSRARPTTTTTCTVGLGRLVRIGC